MMNFVFWQNILKKYWGVSSNLSLLDGEYDLNILVKSNDGKQYVLKIMREDCLQEFVDMQIQAINHLKSIELKLPFPNIIQTISGKEFIHCKDEFGNNRLLWLIKKLPGQKYVEFKRKNLNLVKELGRMIAKCDDALESFEHDFLNRSLKWNLIEACWVEKHIDLIEDLSRKTILQDIMEEYKNIVPKLRDQPFQAIHGDINDHNILVTGRLKDQPSISGLLDFGDMCRCPRVCNLAIAAAYIVLDHDRPEAALTSLIYGYNESSQLKADELDLIWPLLRMRLVVSVVNSTLMSKENPDDPYITVSQASAWKFLERRSENSRFIAARLRSTCGLPVVDGADRVLSYLEEARGSFAQIFDFDLNSVPMGSLSVENSSWPRNPFSLPLEEALEVGSDIIAKDGFWMGYYNEPRLIYTEPAFRNGPWKASDRRTVHLGIDIFGPADLEIRAPIKGKVVVAENRTQHLDYGGVIILEHETPRGDLFYTLYGHLDPKFLKQLKVGDLIQSGTIFCTLGSNQKNGGWAPHLHFQLALMTDGIEKDWPGVGSPDEMYLWNALCPNPAVLLNLPDSLTHYEPVVKDEVLSDRKSFFSSNLSISYNDPILVTRGWKHHLFDEWGRPYLDAYNNVPHVGHSHPRIQEVAAKQMHRVNTNTRYLHPIQTAFAKKILSKFTKKFDVCFFVNSGSEANELALRLARAHTKSKGIVTLDHGYHGNTTGAIDISAYKFNAVGGVGQVDWVELVDLPDDFRGKFKRNDADCGRKFGNLVNPAIERLEKKQKKVGAFIAETFPSVAGQIIPPHGYLQEVYKNIRNAGGLCIADEVQTGLGRLGEYYFGFEQQEVEPDIVVLGKPIGNGHPIGVVVTTKEIAGSFADGPEFFSTFGGSTLSCMIGNEVLEIVDDEGLQENAKQMGDRLLTGLRGIKNNFPQIGDVRGMGLFLGIDLVKNNTIQDEDKDLCTYIKNRMRDYRILIGSEGPKDNVLKIRPPLTIDSEGVDMILHFFEKIMKEV